MAEQHQGSNRRHLWDPMKDDFEDPLFNNYITKSGVNLASQKGHGDKITGVVLYVSGIPSALTKDALKTMFSEVGNVISVSDLKYKEDSNDCFCFVTMDTVQAAERAIQRFNKLLLSGDRYQLTVDIANSREKKSQRIQQQPSESLGVRSEIASVQPFKRSTSSLSSSSASDKIRLCAVCQKQAFQQCPKCKTVYCSRECQQRDWPKHKIICQSSGAEKKQIVHTTANSRTPGSNCDGDSEKCFDITTGKKGAPVITEPQNGDTDLAGAVSDSRNTKDAETPYHHEMKMTTQGTKLDGQVTAVHCSLQDIKPPGGQWTSEAVELASRLMSDKIHLPVKQQEENNTAVDVIRAGDGSATRWINTCELLIKNRLAVPVADEMQAKYQQLPRDDHNDEQRGQVRHVRLTDLPVLSRPQCDLVRVVYAPSINNIILQLMSQVYVDHLQAVHNVMDNFRPNISIYQPEAGDLVAAKYSQDGIWYRAEVKKVISPLRFQVYFIDYGNEEELSNTEIASLPEEMYKHPVLGIRCSLAGMMETPSWNKRILENQLFRMKVIHHDSGEKLEVELYNNSTGVLINDQLAELGFAFRKVEQVGTDLSEKATQKSDRANSPSHCAETCASHSHTDTLGDKHIKDSLASKDTNEKSETQRVMSADVPYQTLGSDQIMAVTVYYRNCSEFYIMCAEKELILDVMDMAEKLQKTYWGNTNMDDMEDSYHPDIGELVAAYCVDDKCWYRAEVLRSDVSSCEVYYTEYGNKEVVSVRHIRQLIPQFAKLPKQALKCHLKQDLTFSGEDRLGNAIQNVTLTYMLQDSRITDSYTVIDILHDSTSVIHELLKKGLEAVKKPRTSQDAEPEETAAQNGEKYYEEKQHINSKPTDDLEALQKEVSFLKNELSKLTKELLSVKEKMKELEAQVYGSNGMKK